MTKTWNCQDRRGRLYDVGQVCTPLKNLRRCEAMFLLVYEIQLSNFAKILILRLSLKKGAHDKKLRIIKSLLSSGWLVFLVRFSYKTLPLMAPTHLSRA